MHACIYVCIHMYIMYTCKYVCMCMRANITCMYACVLTRCQDSDVPTVYIIIVMTSYYSFDIFSDIKGAFYSSNSFCSRCIAI